MLAQVIHTIYTKVILHKVKCSQGDLKVVWCIVNRYSGQIAFVVHATHHKLCLGGADLGDFGPGEGDLGVELVLDAVEVDAEGVDSEEGVVALGVHHREVVYRPTLV